MSPEALVTEHRCPVLQKYSKEAQATAAGFLRTGLMLVPWVREQVAANSRLNGEKREIMRAFEGAMQPDGVVGSLGYLLVGNGIATTQALKDVREVIRKTCYPDRDLSGLMEADPAAAAVVLDAKQLVHSFLEQSLASK